MRTVLEFGDFVFLVCLTLVAIIVISGMLGVLARGSGVNLKPRELARLARLEAKVDLLLRHAGLAYDADAEVLKHSDGDK